jgi:hypothetical protein
VGGLLLRGRVEVQRLADPVPGRQAGGADVEGLDVLRLGQRARRQRLDLGLRTAAAGGQDGRGQQEHGEEREARHALRRLRGGGARRR